MRTFSALVKREYWESSAFWVVPGVFAAVMVFASLFGLFTLAQHVDPAELQAGMGELFAMDTAERRAAMSAILVALGVPFNMFLVGVMFFYSLDSLYGDRRDRSILFWKSMPVSDVQTVLSKLAMVMVVGPAVTLAVVIAFQLVALVMGVGVAIWAGVDGWYLALDPVVLVRAWGVFAWALIAQSLVYVPIIAWLMLASAWARKAPFLWAVVPPVAVIIVEGWLSGFTGRTVLGNWLAERVSHGLPLALHIDARRIEFGEHTGNTGVVDIKFDLLWSGFMWSGIAIAVVLLAGAVWLRRYRAEAE